MTANQTAHAPTVRRIVPTVIVLIFLLATSAVPRAACAESPFGSATGAVSDTVDEPRRRLYVGMVTLHFRDLDRGLDNNWLLGLSWGKIYGATLLNSFGNRSYTGGIQGTVKQWSPSKVTVDLGYRAGLITGYDERFIPLAGKIPVLPLVQPLLRVDGRRLGVELSYSGIIASSALNVRF